MKKRLVTIAVVLGLIFPIPTSGNAADVDKTDNKAPILVSLQIEKSNLALNETTRIKLIIRDDKNDIGGSIYIQFQSPNDAPGSLRPYVFFTASGKGYSNVVKENSYIEYTYSIPVKAPEWPGSYTAFQIFLLEDLNGNKSAFYLNQKCRNINDAFGQQALAFPEVVPECNIDFTVRKLNPAEKAAADKAAADKAAEKEAADKAAADKAAEKEAADKAAADRLFSDLQARVNSTSSALTKLDAEVDSLIKKYPSMKTELNLYKKKIALFTNVNQQNLLTAELNLAGITSKIVSIKATYLKIARSIICVKGTKTLKVVDVKPVCPRGYKQR